MSDATTHDHPKEIYVTTVETPHEPESWFWEAGSAHCPHGAQLDHERHQPADECVICLDAPMGEVCGACSIRHGEAVPWSACDARLHAQVRPGAAPTSGSHQPVEVWVGTTECLERECDELFDDEGNEIPGRDRCSHIRTELVCGGCSTQTPDGRYEPAVAWPGEHANDAA